MNAYNFQQLIFVDHLKDEFFFVSANQIFMVKRPSNEIKMSSFFSSLWRKQQEIATNI